MVLKVLEFGAKKLFKSQLNGEGAAQKEGENLDFNGEEKVRREYQVDAKNLDFLLDRKAQF